MQFSHLPSPTELLSPVDLFFDEVKIAPVSPSPKDPFLVLSLQTDGVVSCVSVYKHKNKAPCVVWTTPLMLSLSGKTSPEFSEFLSRTAALEHKLGISIHVAGSFLHNIPNLPHDCPSLVLQDSLDAQDDGLVTGKSTHNFQSNSESESVPDSARTQWVLFSALWGRQRHLEVSCLETWHIAPPVVDVSALAHLHQNSALCDSGVLLVSCSLKVVQSSSSPDRLPDTRSYHCSCVCTF